jgi:hypothetical protein
MGRYSSHPTRAVVPYAQQPLESKVSRVLREDMLWRVDA